MRALPTARERLLRSCRTRWDPCRACRPCHGRCSRRASSRDGDLRHPDHRVAGDQRGELIFSQRFGAWRTLGENEVTHICRAIPHANFHLVWKLKPEFAKDTSRIDDGARSIRCGLVPGRWQAEQDPLTRDKAKAATAAELIARGIATARRDFAADPGLEAEIVGDLAQLQFSLGDVKDARAHFERLVEQRRALDGEDSIAYGVALSNLGGAQMALGERDAAGPAIERSVEILRRLAGPDALETANAEMRLQRLTLERGDAEAALPLAQHVLSVYAREKGETHGETLQRRYNLGVNLEALDRLDEAEAELRAVIAAREAAGEGDHVQLVYPRTVLADVLRRKRDYAAAAALYDAALATARREVGENHRLAGQIAMRRGDLLRRMRRYDDALAALAEAERVFAPIGSPELGQVFVYRGQVFLERERPADAVEWYGRAVEHYRKTVGPDTVYTRGAELSLAKSRAYAGDTKRAIAEAEASAAAVRKTAAPDTFEHAFAGESLGEIYQYVGRHEDALREYRDARGVLAKIYGEDHSGVASVDWALAKSLLALGRDRPEARERIDRAIAVLRKANAEDPDIGEALLTSAALAQADGDAARAAREYAEAARILEREYGPDHALVRQARARGITN